MNRHQLLQAINISTAPILRKLRLLVQRAVITQTKYIKGIRVMQVKLPAGNALSDVEHIEPFGFTSHPPDNSEAIVLSLAGNGSHSLVICAHNREYKMEIAKGEAAIYNEHGDYVHIKKDRTIEMKSAVKVLVNAPETECTGNLTVKGTTTLQSTLDVTGATTLQNTLSVTGATTLTTMAATTGTYSTGVTVAGISFSAHRHDYQDGNGNGTSTKTTQGAKA